MGTAIGATLGTTFCHHSRSRCPTGDESDIRLEEGGTASTVLVERAMASMAHDKTEWKFYPERLCLASCFPLIVRAVISLVSEEGTGVSQTRSSSLGRCHF